MVCSLKNGGDPKVAGHQACADDGGLLVFDAMSCPRVVLHNLARAAAAELVDLERPAGHLPDGHGTAGQREGSLP